MNVQDGKSLSIQEAIALNSVSSLPAEQQNYDLMHIETFASQEAGIGTNSPVRQIVRGINLKNH